MAQYDKAVDHYKRGLKIFALLGNDEKTQLLRQDFQRVAHRSGADIDAVMHWIEQWLDGHHEVNLCR
jgi:hypothetical protein